MRVFVTAGCVYLAYCAFVFLVQRRLLFPGTHLTPVREVALASLSDVESLWLENGAGRSEAWFLPLGSGPAGSGPGPSAIFMHGNAEFIDDWIEPMRAFADLGLRVLLVEYPGYGRSTGKPTETSVLAGVTAAYDWLAARDDVDARRIVAVGRSLGAGAAVGLAARRPVAALVLQSAFASVGDLALRSYLAPPFLARDRFDNVRGLESYPGPVLVVHGTEDRIVSYRHAVRLAGASRRAELVPLACGHNDCPPSWPEFRARVADFLQRQGILPPDGNAGVGR